MRHVLTLLLLLFSGAMFAQIVIQYETTPSCANSCTGSVNLLVNGGSAPYLYSWSNGIVTASETLTDVCPGTYQVTATDNMGNTAAENIVVTEYAPIIANANGIFGGCAGQPTIILIEVYGGVAPYTVIDPFGGPVQQLSDNIFQVIAIAPGTYFYSIVDAAGCTSEAIVNVIPPIPITINIATDCNNITGIVFGGTPPYQYQWTGPNGFNSGFQIINNLEAGTYTLNIVDANGCTAFQEITIGDGFDLAIFPCGNDIYSQVSGTSGNSYTYLWSDNSTNPTLTDVAPGLYSLTVVDNFNCSQTASTILGAGDTCPALVRGLVYRDNDFDCISNSGDDALSGWLVKAEGTGLTTYTTADATGHYILPFNTEGNYILSVLPWSGLWVPCANDIPIVVSFQDTVDQDFGIQTDTECPLLDIDITAPFLRRCSTNVYTVHYCNYGTADAENASVEVSLDPHMTYQSSTVPAVAQGDNVYSFEVGNIPIGDCGSFTIEFYLECSALLGQNHCTEAHIFPDDNCFPEDPLWDGSNIDVNVSCVNDSVAFLIQNTGTGDMQAPLDYLVVEDQIILMTEPFQLNQGEQLAWKLPAEGMTYFLLAEQSPGNPSSSAQAAWNDGCNGGTGEGSLNLFPLGDEDPFIDTDCQNNIGSFDPNDKQGFPLGLGDEHAILRGTELEYLIRFQNTGTDTAFLVVIRDTLSPLLDISTIRPGAASHNYDFEVYGDRVVQFSFNNILLPDSTVNEAASHGFVAFRVSPVAGLDDGTQLHNKAGIYFDFNEPVITNLTTHTIVEKLEDVLPVAVQFVPGTLATFQVYPNPMSESTVIELQGQFLPGATLTLTDSRGVAVRTLAFRDGRVVLQRDGLVSGLYWAIVRSDEGGVLGVARVVVAENR
jgi:hypothetical protein